MNNRPAKAAAEGLLKQYRLSRPTLDALCRALAGAGYELIDFDPEGPSESLSLLTEKLEIRPWVLQQNAFTYRKGSLRLVFVRESLGTEEKKLALAHELGHILCGHMDGAGLTGGSAAEEFEANEFVHALFSPSLPLRVRNGFLNHKARFLAAAAAVIVLAAGALYLADSLSAAGYYGEYYVTTGGSRYHTRDCQVIRSRTNVSRLTVEQYESGRYTPCLLCIGE